MRKTAAMILSLFLMSGTAFADTPKDGDPQPAQTAKSKKPAKKPAKSATAILAEQVEALRQSMEANNNRLDNCRTSWRSATRKLATQRMQLQPPMPRLATQRPKPRLRPAARRR